MAHYCAEDFLDGGDDTKTIKQSQTELIQSLGGDAGDSNSSDARSTGADGEQNNTDGKSDGSSDVSANAAAKSGALGGANNASSKRNQSRASAKK
ncbi:hypothetical protein [Campylobacter sp. RM9328]|uniref:hypothetical protein n=1 Tax=Campylobacter sp. RM9328 TaxID=1705720 RepID=UPI001475F73C|nr:hypothetical protein [Campylobacter sp. RM9328]